MNDPVDDYDDDNVISNEFDDGLDEDYENEEGALTEEGLEKEEDFEEADLIQDEDIDDNDVTQYQEILEDVKELAQNKNPYKTGNFLYKYELPRIVSSRAAAIQNGAPPLIKLVDPKDPARMLRDPLEIAEEELRQGKLPLMVERPLPSKVPHKPTYEQRPLSTLIYTLD